MPTHEDFQNENNHSFVPRSRRMNRGEIRCAQSGEVFHPSTDIYTNGHYSHKLQMWFSNTYYYNEYCFVNSIHAYEDSAFRNQMAKHFTRVKEATERMEKRNAEREANRVQSEGVNAIEREPDECELVD